MRLWLKDSERRPDPEPVKTDDRKAVLIGMTAWLIALTVIIFFLDAVLTRGYGWWLWTCAAGLGLGLFGLLYTQARHR